MANEEPLAILKQGVRVWNEWRAKNPELKIDLRYADLRGVDLTKVELSDADLTDANLSRGNLSFANLTGVQLSMAKLQGANFSGANLVWANLGVAGLDDANLSGANLWSANLRVAELYNTNLYKASLAYADLREAKLSGANLSNTFLAETHFVEALLTGVDFSEATILETFFSRVDLSQARGLDRVIHHSPSSIDIDTIYKSKGNIPEVFLRGCGVPEDMIAYAHSLRGKAFEFYSCFISHSAKDKRFCERLYADLQAKGVRVWYFPEDAKWGETVWGELDRSIKIYDKLIVVCSENSLQSGPVKREIERALNREDKEGKGILFPIRIDDYIFDTWEHERKADVVRKVVGDFSGWDKDAVKYEKAFDRLLKGLQAA
ncbi:MAG: toll/interleukin-1 receptor domain-containing protein [Chloroflexi bacterium]|nr:toll/interleukin-1 receptor domain-containing protein [Chloroflexota bacterium]